MISPGMCCLSRSTCASPLWKSPTGMEVDAERAAPTFEAFLGAWQWSRASCGSSCSIGRRDRVMALAGALCTTLLVAAGMTSESLRP